MIRVYEASGRPTPAVDVALHVPIASAHEANLLEDPGQGLEVENDTVRFDLHAFEIKTILVEQQRERDGGAAR